MPSSDLLHFDLRRQQQRHRVRLSRRLEHEINPSRRGSEAGEFLKSIQFSTELKEPGRGPFCLRGEKTLPDHSV
jgi:hypothetical protein